MSVEFSVIEVLVSSWLVVQPMMYVLLVSPSVCACSWRKRCACWCGFWWCLLRLQSELVVLRDNVGIRNELLYEVYSNHVKRLAFWYLSSRASLCSFWYFHISPVDICINLSSRIASQNIKPIGACHVVKGGALGLGQVKTDRSTSHG